MIQIRPDVSRREHVFTAFTNAGSSAKKVRCTRAAPSGASSKSAQLCPTSSAFPLSPRCRFHLWLESLREAGVAGRKAFNPTFVPLVFGLVAKLPSLLLASEEHLADAGQDVCGLGPA